MFRVRVVSQIEGKRKGKRQISTDTFLTHEDAEAFVNDSIRRQESICWKAWGLMVTKRNEQDGKLMVDYIPACNLFAKLSQTFEIMSA